jgi:hypothetical protein
MIAKTKCNDEPQDTFVDKNADCKKSEFYKLVESVGNGFFFLGKNKQIMPGNGSRGYEGMMISSKTDDEQAILYLLEQLGVKENSRIVNLVNIYKELPISNNAEILEVRGARVVMHTNELQIATIKSCSETFIESEHFPLFILGRLEEYDIKRSTVTLINFSYAEVYTNLRNTVRVRLSKPTNVVMKLDNNINISGIIQDISYGGCGMNTLATDGLDNANGVSLNLKLWDPSTSQYIEVDIPCVVVRVDNSRSPFKVALNFIHNKQTQELVSKFIYQRQMEIVKELREALL